MRRAVALGALLAGVVGTRCSSSCRSLGKETGFRTSFRHDRVAPTEAPAERNVTSRDCS